VKQKQGSNVFGWETSASEPILKISSGVADRAGEKMQGFQRTCLDITDTEDIRRNIVGETVLSIPVITRNLLN
jgi:hypothetical protein